MATIVRGAIPSEEFALGHTLSALPDVEIECERIIESGDQTVMPLVWIRHADRSDIDDALREDPSVDEVTCLSEFDDEFLYRMAWVDHVHLLLQMITNSHATILDAYGWGDEWQFRVLYPARDDFARTHDFAAEHGLRFEVDSIREMDAEPAGRYGLTESQFEALVTAAREGYFEVPRRISLSELADKMGVSHQSLSERIRRGTDALVEDSLLIGSVPDDFRD
ncbi:DNA-binding protein [Haloferax sp. Atlit-10N]|uniref:helix-turn-helix domain-containing protein n=1 Tax=unclassified Haloferax TaxID=2625095 RepID=UPI000E222CD5|nr:MULTISPECIES: helix-turn-helix domain-containing protein [unclassified Haloferax]RDZ46336.1 DNA-binding protein [Haloferax sp. Atlit-16N]RDZ60169.1 DNA-binding protein [Haloferax sp. Atlit-10N]